MSVCKNGFKILAANYVIDATITARDTVNDDLNKDNIKHHDRYLTARWDTTEPVVIGFEFPSPRQFDTALLVGLNLSSSGTVSIKAWRDAGQTGDLKVDESDIKSGIYKAPIDIIPGVDVYGAKYDNADPVTKLETEDVSIIQSGQIIITDPNNQDGFIDLPHLMIGNATYFDSGYLSHGFSGTAGGDIQRSYNKRAVKGTQSHDARAFTPTFPKLKEIDFIRFRKLEKAFKNNAWYIFGRPWASGSVKLDYEFLANVGNIKTSSSGDGRWNITLDINEV